MRWLNKPSDIMRLSPSSRRLTHVFLMTLLSCSASAQENKTFYSEDLPLRPEGEILQIHWPAERDLEYWLAKADQAAHLFTEGNLQGALEIQEEVVDSFQQLLGGKDLETVTATADLAAIHYANRNLAVAQKLQQQVFTHLQELLGIEHPDTLNTLSDLAATFFTQGNIDKALSLQELVWHKLRFALGGEHPDMLTAKSNLAVTLSVAGDSQEATRLLKEVLNSRIRLQREDHPDTLKAKSILAATLFKTLNPPLSSRSEALRLQEEVLAARRLALGDEHLDTWSAMHSLASMLKASGRLMEAAQLFETLIATRQEALGPQYQPNTEEEANQFFLLGNLHRELYQFDAALATYRRGLDALEAQTLRVDFSATRRDKFRERYRDQYQETQALCLLLDKPACAFQTLERYRTQGLLSSLLWKHHDLQQDIPKDMSRELSNIARRYDTLTRERDLHFPRIIPNLLAEQAGLRQQREAIQGQLIDLRRSRGGLLQPLDAESVRNVLEPGTLMLSFNIDAPISHLLLLSSATFQMWPLEVTSGQIWTQLQRLRSLDQAGIDASHQGRRELSMWLFEKLLEPVAPYIDDAERIVILPDGPLNYLHFAALTRPTPDDPRGWQYLAEWKPVHTVQSATVYGELIARRAEPISEPKEWDWIGFGDPIYPSEMAGAASPQTSEASKKDPEQNDGSQTRTTRDTWNGLKRLPYTNNEVKAIKNLFPSNSSEYLVRAQASEDAARNLIEKARIIHFATHGKTDSAFPMDSFLALSLLEGQDGAQHNGLLQAWEIANDLQLDADLVVLSACVTALGPNRGGEGLISLSRAFQIAGARSVLASLWAVNDLSTSELMIRFYKHLRNGETKDRALQLAQQELIAGPIEVTLDDGTVVTKDFSSPYHWAAFQLIGDWR